MPGEGEGERFLLLKYSEPAVCVKDRAQETHFSLLRKKERAFQLIIKTKTVENT